MAEYIKHPVDLSRGIYDYIGTAVSPATDLPNAVVGSTYRYTAGGTGSVFWQKTTGGWEALATAGGSPSWASITGKPTTIAGFGITDFNSLGDARWILASGETRNWATTGTVTATGAISSGSRIISTLGSAVLGRQGLFQNDVQGNALWWGHANTEYKNTLGSYNSAGFPYISFFSYQDTGDVFKRAGSTTYPFQIRAEATGQVLNFLYAGLSTADSAISWTSGMWLGAGVLTVAAGITIGGPLLLSYANPTYQASRILAQTGTNGAGISFENTGGRFFVGSDNSAGTGIGAGTYNSYIWTESARAIVFGVNNVIAGSFATNGIFTVNGAGVIFLQPTTGTSGSYLNYRNTGGDYYIGIDNSGGSTFGSGSAYAFSCYVPGGLAWWINKTTKAMTVVSTVTASDFILA